MHPTHAPIRLVTGAFILNSGLNKLKADEEGQAQMHGWASSVYPMFKDMKPGDFTKLLAYGEIGLGAMLLLPTVPSAVAGGALTAFGASLVGMYLKTPGMTEADGIRPTAEGTGLAKDVWLVGAGLTLATQSFLSGTKHAAKAVAGGVAGAAGAVAGGVTGAAGAVAEGVTGAAGSVAGGLTGAASTLASGVTGAAGSVTGGVTGAAGSVAHGLTGALGSGSTKAEKSVKGLLSSAHDTRAELADALVELADAMMRR